MLIINMELNNMRKKEFDAIDHTTIWLWKVEKEMRNIKKANTNVWSDWSDNDAYRYGYLEGLQEVMQEKGVKFLKVS